MSTGSHLSKHAWTLSEVRCFTLFPGDRFNWATVNVIVVVGHEKLNVEMQRMYGSHMTVVKIPKSGGVSRPK